MKIIELTLKACCLLLISILASACGVNKSLLAASIRGDLDRVRSKVESGENINDATYFNGMTPLIGAAFGGHYEVIKYLISKGANVNSQANALVLDYSYKTADNRYKFKISKQSNGQTPLTGALNSANFGKDQWDRIVALLLENGANPNVNYICMDALPKLDLYGNSMTGEMILNIKPTKEEISTPLTYATGLYYRFFWELCGKGLQEGEKIKQAIFLKRGIANAGQRIIQAAIRFEESMECVRGTDRL